MKQTDRRHFLKQSGAALAGSATLTLLNTARSAPASRRLVMGLIGPGGMGTNLLKSFAVQPDVAIAYVCDPDANRLEEAAKATAELTGTRPRTEKDLRRVLEDKAVDAVVIATPDHWHAPATLLACEAGKHVYVEKPCSHNVREGRLMVEAARRHRRVVQVGTQSRSAPHVQKAIELLRGGAIGEVLVAKAWNSQRRGSIGHAQPANPPAHLDYDLWVGPAPMMPYQPNLLHAVWRWWYAFGCGDIGNDGVHDIDIARWGLGVDTHPERIAALGGKYVFDDDQQFPDTQYVSFEYGTASGRKRQLVFEQRIWSPYVQEGHENGNAFYGTEGMLILGKHSGWKLYGPRNQLKEEMAGSLEGTPHHRNFLECIQSGNRPQADIQIGHLSATLCHLGNIATRVSRQLRFDPQQETIVGDDEANGYLRRAYRPGHWAAPR